MRNPRSYLKPLAIGAPDPVADIPVKPSRMIHFFDPSNPKMAAKLPELATKADILLGNLEDAIAAAEKLEARQGLVK
ncbi:MAG: CoA ester lyase, partial [Gammaproteobacteria bacterium]